MSEARKYFGMETHHVKEYVLAKDYDALKAERDLLKAVMTAFAETFHPDDAHLIRGAQDVWDAIYAWRDREGNNAE